MNRQTEVSDQAYGADFASYYDLITSHKDYAAEGQALVRMIEASAPRPSPRVLDVGCGTGTHAAFLAERGYEVTAIDPAPQMARQAAAKAASASVRTGDLAALDAGHFDVAYSLFNVVNCLDSLEELLTFTREIASRLVEGGVVLVEAWNPIAVIATPPETVVRTYETEHGRVTRTVVPRPDFLRQRLELEYEIVSPAGRTLGATHHLVLFSPLEVEFALMQAGLADVEVRTALPELSEATASDRMLAFTAVRTDAPA
jgi:SAM-dependent methyltransferase